MTFPSTGSRLDIYNNPRHTYYSEHCDVYVLSTHLGMVDILKADVIHSEDLKHKAESDEPWLLESGSLERRLK